MMEAMRNGQNRCAVPNCVTETLDAVFRDINFADRPSQIDVFEIFKLCMTEDTNDFSKRGRVI